LEWVIVIEMNNSTIAPTEMIKMKLSYMQKTNNKGRRA